MKTFIIFILSFILMLPSAFSRGAMQTQDYGNIRVFSASNHDFEEFRKAFIVGQLAKTLVNELQYTDSVYLDFYHNHYEIDDLPPIFHLSVQQIGDRGRNSTIGGEKIVIRQYAYQYDFEGMLKLLEYAINHKTQIKQQQTVKRNPSAHGTRSFLSIKDEEIQDVLQKPASESLKTTLQTRVDRPILANEPPRPSGSVNYYWQNNAYHIFHNTRLRGEQEKKDVITMALSNIYTFHPLYPMTVIFDSPASFYVVNPHRRDKETGAYLPSTKQTIEYPSKIDRGKKIEAISSDDISIFFRYSYGVIGTPFPARLLLYFSETDTLIQDAYASHNIKSDTLRSSVSHAEIREMKEKPTIHDFTTWKKQLDFIVPTRLDKRIGKERKHQELSLISYAEVNDNDTINIHDFQGERLTNTITEIQKNIPGEILRIPSGQSEDVSIQKKIDVLRNYQGPEKDLKLLKLTWALDDQQFHTYAVISEFHDSIIYDDIISYVRNPAINVIRGSFRYNEWQLFN